MPSLLQQQVHENVVYTSNWRVGGRYSIALK